MGQLILVTSPLRKVEYLSGFGASKVPRKDDRRSTKGLPRPLFNSIEAIEHKKRMMLALPIKKKHPTLVPFGYEVSEDDSKRLIPCEIEFNILYQAKVYWHTREMSRDSVSWWVTDEVRRLKPGTDRRMSGRSLTFIMRDRPPLKCIFTLSEEEREALCVSDYYWSTPVVPKQEA